MISITQPDVEPKEDERIIWIDLETTGIDPYVSNILELAYFTEINGELSDTKLLYSQPIIHSEDKINGHKPAKKFIEEYNNSYMGKRPNNSLSGFSPDGGDDYLFIYSTSVLTFNTDKPRNPYDWLTDDKYEFPETVLDTLMEDLRSKPGTGRWIIAGYNVEYDFNVFKNWVRRIKGNNAYWDIMKEFNYYQHLDVCFLVRWAKYNKMFESVNNKLPTVAQALDLGEFDAHRANADIEKTYQVAKKLLGGLQK